MFLTYRRLLSFLNGRYRAGLALLALLSLIFSVFETFSISVLLPYLKIISDPHSIASTRYVGDLYEWMGSPSPKNFSIQISYLLIFIYAVKFTYSLGFSYFQWRYVRGLYLRIIERVFNNFIHQPYASFVKSNSADYAQGMVSEANNAAGMVMGLIMIVTESLTVLFLFALMLRTDMRVTLMVCALFGLVVVLLLGLFSGPIKKMGQKKVSLVLAVLRLLNESFGNFKLLKLTCREDFANRQFLDASVRYNKIQVVYGVMQSLPRYSIEFLGLSILLFVSVHLIANESVTYFLPKLVLFAVSFGRIMPSINRIVTSANEYNFQKKAVDMVWQMFHMTLDREGESVCNFSRDIRVAAVTFSYEARKDVLTRVDITVSKGEKVGFVGESGAGKSTLVDLICGLIRPNEGAVLIDGVPLTAANVRSWRRKIGYIPQNIYLFDGTVAENVAIASDYDADKVTAALKSAKIYDFLMQKDGLATRVGEGGILLSGGQKQRVAIARALYHDPEILVLDEATSALDDKTETGIIEEIFSLASGKTVLVIAHRLTSLKYCDTIYEVRGGVVQKSVLKMPA